MRHMRYLLALGTVFLVTETVFAQSDSGLSPACEVICEWGRDFQKQDCGCPAEAFETGLPGGVELPPPGQLPPETPIQIQEILEEVELHYLWSIENVDNYQAIEESNIAPMPTPVFSEKDFINGNPYMRTLDIDEVSQRAMQKQADDAAAAAGGTGTAARAARDAQIIANIDPAEYLALLAQAGEIVQEGSREEPSVSWLFNNPAFEEVLNNARDAAGDYNEFQRERRDESLADTLFALSHNEESVLWDHESLRVGTGWYYPNARGSAKFVVHCLELGRRVSDGCQSGIRHIPREANGPQPRDDLDPARSVPALILTAEPNIEGEFQEQSYEIIYAEKWVESERFFAKRGEYTGDTDKYQGARPIRAKFTVRTLGEHGFEQITVERVTDKFEQYHPLEVATRVRDRVTRSGVSTPEVEKLLTVKKVNEGPPSLQELTEQFGGRIGVAGATPQPE